MPGPEPSWTLTRDDGWARLRLTDPGRRNALTSSMLAEMEASVRACDRPLQIEADGPAFCAGLDLTEVAARLDYPSELIAMLRKLAILFEALLLHPYRTQVVVGGPAIGGGAGIALCCDQVTITPKGLIKVPAQVQMPGLTHWLNPILNLRPWVNTGELRRMLEIGITGRDNALINGIDDTKPNWRDAISIDVLRISWSNIEPIVTDARTTESLKRRLRS